MHKVPVETLLKKLTEEERDALQGFQSSLNCPYWFGRVSLCRELIKFLKSVQMTADR